MRDAVKEKTWLGLAAPQVGKSYRLFVAKVKGDVEVFFNPKMVGHSQEQDVDTEYCLSCFDVGVEVPRWTTVDIEWLGIDGDKKKDRFEGNEAAIVQHEMDHLDGKLIIDYRKE